MPDFLFSKRLPSPASARPSHGRWLRAGARGCAWLFALCLGLLLTGQAVAAPAHFFPTACASEANCREKPGRRIMQPTPTPPPRAAASPKLVSIFPFLGVDFNLPASPTPRPTRQPAGRQLRWLPYTPWQYLNDTWTPATHGPIVGGVTDSTATVFVRTFGMASVQLRISVTPDGQGDPRWTPPVMTQRGADFTAMIPLTDLQADTTYYLQVLVNGTAQAVEDLPRFRTFPAAARPVKIVYLTDFATTFNTGTILPANTFAHAGDENADLVVIGGDFDHREPHSLADKRQMFKDLYNVNDPNMASFVTDILWRTPVAHMWDDHDYGRNDEDKGYFGRELSRQAIREFFPLYPTPSTYGIWQKLRLGPVEIFLIDARSQRDNVDDPDGPDKSMLDGDNLGVNGQRYWLEQGLLQSTATWKLLMVQVPFNPTVHKSDSWRTYQFERDWLLDLVRNNRIKGVVFISGDMHAGGIDSGAHSGLPEMVVPTPNFKQCLSVYGADRTMFGSGLWDKGTYWYLNEYRSCNGYGVISASANPPQLRLEVKDSEGGVRLSYNVPWR